MPSRTRSHRSEKKVDDLRAKLNISDAVASGDGRRPDDGGYLRQLESLRIESKAEFDREQTLLGRLKQLDKKQNSQKLAQAIGSATQDSLLSSLLEQLNVAEQRLVNTGERTRSNAPRRRQMQGCRRGSPCQDQQPG